MNPLLPCSSNKNGSRPLKDRVLSASVRELIFPRQLLSAVAGTSGPTLRRAVETGATFCPEDG